MTAEQGSPTTVHGTPHRCPPCDGTGRIMPRTPLPVIDPTYPCRACGGLGYMVEPNPDVAEARQQALTDAIAAVRTEVPSITAINDVRFSDRMVSQRAVIDTLTRLRDGSRGESKSASTKSPSTREPETSE